MTTICDTCRGKGHVIGSLCYYCAGRGTVRCSSCYGKRKRKGVPCIMCGDSRYTACGRCYDGKAIVYCADELCEHPPAMACPICHGKGVIPTQAEIAT